MRLATDPVAERSLHYGYPNAGLAAVELWLAEPPECSVQDRVRVASRSLEPAETIDLGVQTVQRYRVPPGHVLRVDWAFRSLRPHLDDGGGGSAGLPGLSPGERSFYLESSPQIPRHARIEAEARRLAGNVSDPLALAQGFFRSVATEYQYAYPVRRRGALEMLASRRGDCGQFVSLFVALCRAAEIPSRVLVGTLLTPSLDQAHAWAEIWVDGVGWVPADPALGNALAHSHLPGAGDPNRAFGQLERGYFAFSIGFDIALGDPYGAAVRPSTLPARIGPRLAFGGESLSWGFATLQGRVPYLQPVYPRCYPGKGVNALLRCSPLGHWSLDAKWLPWALAQDVLEQTWFLVALLLVLLGLIAANWSTAIAACCVAAVFALAIARLGIRAWLRHQPRRAPARSSPS
ncbi:MAG: transglutaminase domain-containing protein [Thermoanaerobaculia bacterium]